jgi:hypothetical protein
MHKFQLISLFSFLFLFPAFPTIDLNNRKGNLSGVLAMEANYTEWTDAQFHQNLRLLVFGLVVVVVIYGIAQLPVQYIIAVLILAAIALGGIATYYYGSIWRLSRKIEFLNLKS